ncbi:MAG: DEAD/DEAH box helicase, partial [Gemmatimonadales bacterium]
MPPDALHEARRLLQRHFGFPDFRALQTRVVRAVLAGDDVLGVLPTGGGKSVCFQIPALLLPGFALVVSPLISLMQDQVGAARARGLPAAALNSALSNAEQRRVLSA